MNAGNETSQLSEARRALIARRLRGADAAEKPSIEALAEDAPKPVSSAQLRLYLLDQLYPGNSAYHMYLALRLRGDLDRDALRQALETVVGRHDALRTHFVRKESHVEQVVAPPDDIILTTHGHCSDAEIVAIIDAPFDLATGPLLRADLFEEADRDHLLVLTVHHIVADEWSMANLRRELGSAYDSLVTDQPVQLNPLAIQYADYAAWQKRRGDNLAGAQLDYWRRQLDGASDGLDLPFDKPRPVRPRFRGELRQLRLRPEIETSISRLAQDNGATAFMVWLTALNALLYRYTAQTDICIGTPSANRPTAEIEPLIGLFLNSLVIRSSLDADMSFKSLLAQVRDTVIDAFANQDLPFDVLVAKLQHERDLSHNPMFQVMLVMEHEPDGVGGFGDLDVSRVEFDTRHAKLDLTVFVRPGTDGTMLSAEYDSDLFARDSIDALLRRFGQLVEQVAGQPSILLDRISLVSELDPPARLQAPSGLSRWHSVIGALADAVALDPDTCAIRGTDSELSYAELDMQSNHIAQALVSLGIGSGHLVPIRIARSPGQLAAMLGVLKSGAAYVPLDPDYPIGRHRRIIEQLRDGARNISHLLTIDALTDETFGLEALTLEAIAATDHPSDSPAVDIDADDLAYVIHTSGSSGEPKGVAVTHANLAATTAARFDYYDEPPASFLLVPSFAFDSSVAGTYWTLLAGGTIVLAPAGSTPDPRELGMLIESESVTHTLMLPALYELLLDTDCDLTSLRTVIVAGEACMSELVLKHFTLRSGETRLFNEYGPTEATVWASVYECTVETGHDVAIGTAVPGTQLYVADVNGALVPAGIPGELYIGGSGIAAGYLDEPGLTAESFVEIPTLGHGRLYRTGDRVRLDARGQLRFLGRLDDQLKIRGFRIETGEIEAQLRLAPGVSDAAVIPEHDRDGRAMSLVAYVAPASVSTGKLRDSLHQNVPDYMLPRAIYALDALPHMPNGKLDRQRLTEMADTPVSSEPEAIEGETAQAVAELWRRLLGVEVVSASDDFFALGGHSLMGMSLMIEIERRFGVSLPLTVLFESPRLSELTARVQQANVAHGQRFVTALRETGTRTPLFCIHAGARLIIEHLPEDQPVYLVYQRVGELDPETTSVESIAQQYLSEMRTLRPHGPYALIGFSTGAQIAFEIAQRLRADGEVIDALVLGDPPSHRSSVYYKRRMAERFEQVRREHGPLRKTARAIEQALRLVWRRVDGVRLRLLAAYFQRTRSSSSRLRRVASSLILLGAGLWIGGGLWMNAHDWRPAIVPLEAGAVASATFTPPTDATYEVQLEVEHDIGPALLNSHVLAVREPSPLDVRWQIDGDTPRLASDVSDYLYIERGPISLLGHLRRIALRVPFGQNRLYFHSFGLFGEPISARGLASFPARAGETLTLTATSGDISAVASGNPRLVVRQSRKAFADHYGKVSPFMLSGIVVGALGLALLGVAVWRERQGVPADVLRFLERRHLGRLSSAYDYTPYDGELTLVYPASYADHLERSEQFWNKLTTARARVELISGAKGHLDLVRSGTSAEIARLLDRLLGD